MTRKLARSKMRSFAKKLAIDQGGKCPLSGEDLDFNTPRAVVIDHNHSTGLIRGALTRSANACEGKVRRAIETWGGVGRNNEEELIAYLRRLADYLESEPYDIYYPYHQTEEEAKRAERMRLSKRKAERKAKERVREHRKRQYSRKGVDKE